MPLSVALRTAQERSLDLVEVSPLAQPPVCRIVNFGRFQYQQERQERKNRSRQKRVEVKGIRLSLTIGEHDTAVRRDRTLKFLAEGHRVKIEMILRGRQNQHRDRARVILQTFVQTLGEGIKIEQPISMQGNRMMITIGK